MKNKSTDIYSKKKRSQVMGLIKGRDTLLEINFGKVLRKNGLRFTRNAIKLPGKPDFASKSRKIVIFIDGCFWHGCKKHFKLPQSNQWFWEEKIGKNTTRDRKITKFYKEMGWTILRIWEHDLAKDSQKVINKIKKV